MSTNNFHNVNASRIYAVLMNREVPIIDEDGNETEETECVTADDFDSEMLIDDIKEQMKETKFHFRERGEDKNELRSYPSNIIATLYNSKEYLGVEVEVHITTLVRGGYYEGGNLDYSICFYANGYESDSIEDCIEEWEYQSDYYSGKGKGLVSMNKGKVQSWLDNTTSEIISEIEKIFENVCDVKLKKVGQFSNGEALYEKA